MDLKEYPVPSFSNQILSFFLKLILAIFAAVFAVSLLFVALFALVLSMLKWLVTGKKPAFAIIWSGLRSSSQRVWPPSPMRSGKPQAPGAGEVVDVEVREIKADQRLP